MSIACMYVSQLNWQHNNSYNKIAIQPACLTILPSIYVSDDAFEVVQQVHFGPFINACRLVLWACFSSGAVTSSELNS